MLHVAPHSVTDKLHHQLVTARLFYVHMMNVQRWCAYACTQ